MPRTSDRDAALVDVVYSEHGRAMLAYATRLLGDRAAAEDVVQEAYLRFSEATQRRLFDEPVGYLYRIVHNLAFDGLRRLSLEGRYIRRDAEQVAVEVAEERPSPEAELIARQELARVLAAIAELPERTRLAFEMHRFGGLKLKEIAQRLGISTSMAHVLVVEAVRHCQRSL